MMSPSTYPASGGGSFLMFLLKFTLAALGLSLAFGALLALLCGLVYTLFDLRLLS